jgi:hypothetical protein
MEQKRKKTVYRKNLSGNVANAEKTCLLLFLPFSLFLSHALLLSRATEIKQYNLGIDHSNYYTKTLR